MRKDKLFIITSYNNCTNDFSKDVRSILLGTSKNFLRKEFLTKRISINKNYLYAGDYYFICKKVINADVDKEMDNILAVLNDELSAIEKSKKIIAIIDRNFGYYDLSKLFYAVILNKEITIFINPDMENSSGYSKWHYFLEICRSINLNIVLEKTIANRNIINYIKNLEKSTIPQEINFNYSTTRILEEMRVFISNKFVFDSVNRLNKDNFAKNFKDDIKKLIVHDVDKIAVDNSKVCIAGRPKLKYNGGFYYYYLDNDDSVLNRILYCYKDAAKAVMKRISTSDLFVVILSEKDLLDNIIELLYAAFLKKKIYVYYDKEIVDENVNDSYIFLIEFARMLGSTVVAFDCIDEKKILDDIKKADDLDSPLD